VASRLKIKSVRHVQIRFAPKPWLGRRERTRAKSEVWLFVFPGSLPLIFATNPADLMQRSAALGAVLSRRKKEKSI
jgi:hypothetical protein